MVTSTYLCIHVGQVGLEQHKIGGELVVKPLQIDILGPEPDQYIVRGFNCIRVTTFEDRVNQFTGLGLGARLLVLAMTAGST